MLLNTAKTALAPPNKISRPLPPNDSRRTHYTHAKSYTLCMHIRQASQTGDEFGLYVLKPQCTHVQMSDFSNTLALKDTQRSRRVQHELQQHVLAEILHKRLRSKRFDPSSNGAE